MNKFIWIVITAITLLVVVVSFSSSSNVTNLLLAGDSSTLGGDSRTTDSQDTAEVTNGDEGVDDNSIQSTLSGLTEVTSTSSVNLLYLLQNASAVNKNSYAYQLLYAYSNLSSGKYNNFPYHVSSETVAGAHANETKLRSFLAPYYTLGSPGENEPPATLTLENSTKSTLSKLGLACSASGDSSAGVCYDANGDGHPDGPLQIVTGSQSGNLADKRRNDNTFDLYSFVDAMNFVDEDYSKLAKKFNDIGQTPDSRAVSMLTAYTHNRGDAGPAMMLFGYPYYGTGGKLSKYLSATNIDKMSAEQLRIATQYPKDLLSWFDQSNISLEYAADNQNGQAIALLLNLAHGGFLDKKINNYSWRQIQTLDDAVIKKIFPNQGKATLRTFIDSTYIKNPWDVLGLSRAEFSRIYGLTLTDYEASYAESSDRNTPFGNTSFYVDSKVTSDIYKNKPGAVVLRAVEGIAMGYAFNTGVGGTYTLMQLAKDAGIKSLTDGAVIDPSNPSALYQSMNQGTYNPSSADPNFDDFLEVLGMSNTLTAAQYNQLSVLYKWSGGTYSQPNRGILDASGFAYLDCSSFTQLGLYMMDSLPKRSIYTATRFIVDGVWMDDDWFNYKGEKYNAKVYQLDKSGNVLNDGRKKPNANLTYGNAEDWGAYLQPGDILAYNGHIITFIGENKTGGTVRISKTLGKYGGTSEATSGVYAPGDYMMFSASSTANLTSIRHLWGKKPYMAFRPAYNIR